MANVPFPVLLRLAKLCGMFGSSHEGERANAAAAASRLIKENGLTWQIVLGVEAIDDLGDAEKIADCLDRRGDLSDWERRFLVSLAEQVHRRGLTARQGEILDRIHARLRT